MRASVSTFTFLFSLVFSYAQDDCTGIKRIDNSSEDNSSTFVIGETVSESWNISLSKKNDEHSIHLRFILNDLLSDTISKDDSLIVFTEKGDSFVCNSIASGKPKPIKKGQAGSEKQQTLYDAFYSSAKDKIDILSNTPPTKIKVFMGDTSHVVNINPGNAERIAEAASCLLKAGL